MIEEFQGDYAFLSNFWPWHGKHFYGDPIVIEYEGVNFPSVEHAYQASKTLNVHWRVKISKTPTPGEAKKMGRMVLLRPDFDNSRLDVMESLLRLKFFSRENWSEELLAKLLETYPTRLQEGNYWGDEFWGKVRVQTNRREHIWKGKNNLGRILMKLRKEAWGALSDDY